jgi:prepilin-type N-terminal cleavage/methylation domain-containing protein
MNKKKYSFSIKACSGFTLLEVMIALAIFGFLMIYVSQMMRSQIRTYNQTLSEISLEQKARTSMMHLLDEIRLNRSTYYEPGGPGVDNGVYCRKPDATGEDDIESCLIDLNPSDINNLPEGTGIYYYNKQLWFRNPDTYMTYLIADQIDNVIFTPVLDHLIKIEVIAKNPQSSQTYELLTWKRLY